MIPSIYMQKYTSINVTFATRDRLKKLGTFHSSYDKIINQLLDAGETNKQ